MKFLASVFFILILMSQAIFAHEEQILEVVSGYVKGEIVIDFKDNVTDTDLEYQNIVKKYNIAPEYNSEFSKKYKLMVANVGENSVDDLLEKLNREKAIEFAEPNYVITSFAFPNDPLYKYQWNLKKINADKAWKYSSGKKIVVAVIDTGVAYENFKHFRKLEDLENTKFTSPYNFVNNTRHANDDNGHGSHVTGTIAQSTNNGKGVAGIAHNAVIMPIKALNASGQGRLSDIADAVRYAADNGAKIINMSLGSPFGSKILSEACKYAHNKGVLIVCAAGNDNSKNPNYPASYKYCIGVSATRYDNNLTFYSNKYKNNFIAAPGGDLTVDQNKDGYKDGILQNTIKGSPSEQDYVLLQGTSMAAPHVAGAAAILMSKGVKNAEDVKKILQKTAYKKGLDLDSGYGAGILDIGSAVKTLDHTSYSNENLSSKVKQNSVVGIIIATILAFILKKLLGKNFKNSIIFKTIMFIIGLIFGTCGLFFIPEQNNLFLNLLSSSPSEWNTTLGWNNQWIAILFKSSLLTIVFLFISLPFIVLRRFALGLTLGIGASLLTNIVSGQGLAIPFSNIWLLINAVICFVSVYGVMKFIPEPVKIKH